MAIGHRLQVNAQLVDVGEGEHVLGELADRHLDVAATRILHVRQKGPDERAHDVGPTWVGGDLEAGGINHGRAMIRFLRIMGLEITRTQHGGSAVLRLEGEVDIATVDQLDEAIQEAVDDEAETVVVDLSGLSFMDSTGLRSVLSGHEMVRAKKRSFIVVSGTGPVSRLIDITGVAGTLDVREDTAFLESS